MTTEIISWIDEDIDYCSTQLAEHYSTLSNMTPQKFNHFGGKSLLKYRENINFYEGRLNKLLQLKAILQKENKQ